mmetsp:Transcript_9295/g.10771  ORF Transcript_9295/g.10771 Transcript_9295/m.10771 type:complete len:210 (-) Transcript_9295:2666-3295(-)
MVPRSWVQRILQREATEWSPDNNTKASAFTVKEKEKNHSKLSVSSTAVDLCSAYATEFVEILAAEAVSIRRKEKKQAKKPQRKKDDFIRFRLKEDNVISALNTLGFLSCAQQIKAQANGRRSRLQHALLYSSNPVDNVTTESRNKNVSSDKKSSQSSGNTSLSTLPYRERREVLKQRHKAKKRKTNAQDMEILEKEQEALFAKAKIQFS